MVVHAGRETSGQLGVYKETVSNTAPNTKNPKPTEAEKGKAPDRAAHTGKSPGVEVSFRSGCVYSCPHVAYGLWVGRRPVYDPRYMGSPFGVSGIQRDLQLSSRGQSYKGRASFTSVMWSRH